MDADGRPAAVPGGGDGPRPRHRRQRAGAHRGGGGSGWVLGRPGRISGSCAGEVLGASNGNGEGVLSARVYFIVLVDPHAARARKRA